MSFADQDLDDIKDIYRRAEGHELVVEGLREGHNLVADQ
jgi:Rab GDP dissociation inhibitor